MYEHQEYPAWRYHATEKAQIVNDPAHEDLVAPAADGWVKSPVELPKPKKK